MNHRATYSKPRLWESWQVRGIVDHILTGIGVVGMLFLGAIPVLAALR